MKIWIIVMQELASKMKSEYACQSILPACLPGPHTTPLTLTCFVTHFGFQPRVALHLVRLPLFVDCVRLLGRFLKCICCQQTYTIFNGKDQILGLMQDTDQTCRRRELQDSLTALQEARRELNAHF